jgi:hypothetical protein
MSAAVDPSHHPDGGDDDRPDLAHVRRMWADDRVPAWLGRGIL